MQITGIIWKDRFIAKNAVKHAVSVADAEEALLSRPVVRKIAKGRVHGEDVYAAMAQIASGRYLIVLFINKGRGTALPISARDMDHAEREYYARQR